MPKISDLVLGTRNLKKRAEMSALLAPLGVRLLTLDDFPSAGDVEETGETFVANARLKASQYAKRLERWVLAEDSGIEVDALGGEPGVYSARFAGEPTDDEANNALLLKRLAGVPAAKRGARYNCCMVLADPSGEPVLECSGECRGVIREAPSGTGGFGYDPLFEIPEFHATFGELGPAVKAAISHRSRAARRFAELLAAYIKK